MGFGDFIGEVPVWPGSVRVPGCDTDFLRITAYGFCVGPVRAGAYAYYNFDEAAQQLEYTAGSVQPKFLNDANVFPFGFETVDDSWVNYWRTGPNEFVGWNELGTGEGTGAKSLGMELAQTRQFAKCQVKQVFEKVCYRSPNGDADNQAVETIATNFENNGRRMKQVFAETAVHCMGD